MNRFKTHHDAVEFVAEQVDQPAIEEQEKIEEGLVFSSRSESTGGTGFVNIYDLAVDPATRDTKAVILDNPVSMTDLLLEQDNDYLAAMGGGYFFLADRASRVPRQLALNLSIKDGEVKSLPAQDGEVVITEDGQVRAETLRAFGILSLNGQIITWSGSKTDHKTEAKVFSNGNTAIHHQDDPLTGSIRVLEEASRYTPPIEDDEYIDVGFIGRGGSSFIGVSGSTEGGVDIFAHDFVLRCARDYMHGNSSLELITVDGINLADFRGSAFSSGPSIFTPDLHQHPINGDRSLGDKPTLTEKRMARTILYETVDGILHLRLFDSRPNSQLLTGVTPTEAVNIVVSEQEVVWGCFLDPGQSSRICLRKGDEVRSIGNRHYLKWPKEDQTDFIWTPNQGRPVVSLITIS